MSNDSIKCPHCGKHIPLSEALSRDIEERSRCEYEKQLTLQQETLTSQFEVKEKELNEKMRLEKEALEADLINKKKEIEEKFREKVALENQSFIRDLESQIQEKENKLQSSRELEIDLRKKQRDLEEKKAMQELEFVRKLDEERLKQEELIAGRLEEQYRMKDAEKEKKLSDALIQVDNLKRKMEQGSQQMQGELLELELTDLLIKEFPFDKIEEVAKGVRGGDIIQKVKTQKGRDCGIILWETKRTKNWNDAWISKLKDDQRDARADLCVLVSETLPQGFHHFRHLDGVWVTDIPSALSLALALRVILIQVASTRELEQGKSDKKELVYHYVTGPEFRNRVCAIIEGFSSMREQLEAEKRAMTRIWDRRAKEIERIISNTAGMYGDLEGLSGSQLPQIQALELESIAVDSLLEEDKA